MDEQTEDQNPTVRPIRPARPARPVRPAPPQQTLHRAVPDKPAKTRKRSKRNKFTNKTNYSGMPRHASADAIAATLDERGKQYGDYMSNAVIIQNIKHAMRDQRGGFFVLEPDAKQSLDEIATKIGRIICGNNSNTDHWRDIEGYARLVRERIEREQKSKK